MAKVNRPKLELAKSLAKVPDVAEMRLGKLLSSSPAKVAKDIGKASLVVIRSQEID